MDEYMFRCPVSNSLKPIFTVHPHVMMSWIETRIETRIEREPEREPARKPEREETRIGKYSKAERRMKIARYKIKKLSRVPSFYKARRDFANKRPRHQGRFIKLNI